MISDYTNWNTEREKLKDEIMRELRAQKDRTGVATVDGKRVINPQLFKTDGQYLTFGPYFFNTQFSTIPFIAFNTAQGIAKVPFIVISTVDKWHYNSGVVDGFTLGLYALKAPLAQQVRLTILYRVEGRSSTYKKGSLSSSWTDPYDDELQSQNSLPNKHADRS